MRRTPIPAHTRIAVCRHTLRVLCWCMTCVGIIGCGYSRVAVVLWPSSSSALQSGDIVQIREIGDTQEEAVLRDAAGENHRLYIWQVMQFDSMDEAEEFSSGYADYRDLFGQSEKKALPLREEANRFSDLLYRLDQGEIIKIIDRAHEISDEAGLQDYWYQALTATGEQGWVFGYYLSLIDIAENTISSGKDASDNIATFLNTIWRPLYFRAMRDSNSFDLARFGTNFGLFPAPLERNIQIRLPDYYFKVEYETPLPESARVFYFGDQKELRITLRGTDRVIAEVRREERVDTFEFTLFDENIQQIVNHVRAESREINNVR